jgi:branched-chain amino acid transport system ATP-binding protein
MLLEAVGLTKRFGGLVAVTNVSFVIAAYEIVGIFGPNGSGKTTLLNLVAGVAAPSAGRLMWKEEAINGKAPHQIAARGIVKTFQNPQLFAELSVAEHVLVAAHLMLKRELGLRRIATLARPAHHRGALRKRAERVLALCRLDRLRDQPASDLSYGNEKMLGVAMALMCEPELLLLDEPATGLDDEETANLSAVLRDLRRDGTTLCIIDHKIGFLVALADRAIALHHGSKIAEGRPAAVLEDAAVIEAYLGQPDA